MALTAVHSDCIDAVQAAIQSIGLTGLPNDQVYAFKFPFDRESMGLRFPAVHVSLPFSEVEQVLGGTNERDDWGYPVLVTIVTLSNQSTAIPVDVLNWRQNIRKKFHNQRLSAVSAVYTCKVEPRAIVDLSLFGDNYDVSYLLVRCITREARS